MAEDLILKASLDTSEAEAEAQKLKASLAKVDGVSTSSNAGKALATNMNSAKLASDAMFRSLTAMGGPIGRIAGMMKAFSDSARMLQSIPGGPGGYGGPGGGMSIGAHAWHGGTNLLGGAMAGHAAGAAVAINEEFKANRGLWLKKLYKQYKADPNSLIMPGSSLASAVDKSTYTLVRTLQIIAGQLAENGPPLDASKVGPFSTIAGIRALGASHAANGLAKLEAASLGAGSKLASFAGKLGQAGLVIGTFAAALKTGLDWQKKLYQTEYQREKARKASLDELQSWMKDRTFSHTMRYGTEEQKRKVIEREMGETDAQLAAISAWRASFDKEKQASGIQWTPSAYREAQADEEAARKERDAAQRKMEFGGAKLDRTLSGQVKAESVEAWWLEQTKKKASLKDARLDLDVAKKALSKFTPKAPVTDELTRIGGSIGGGIDYQRSMANSLMSIDRAVAIIRASVTAKHTPYI